MMPKIKNKYINCACGCGGKFLEKDKYGRNRIFLKGHHTTVVDMKQYLQNRVKINTQGCWEWQHAKTKGYGVITYRTKQHYTHRLSYEFFTGKDINGYEVCHTCDNPSCCNPDHLFLGTHTDNIHDSHSKGRANRPGTILSDSDVVEIRQLNKRSSQKEIATIYNCDPSTISKIINLKARCLKS